MINRYGQESPKKQQQQQGIKVYVPLFLRSDFRGSRPPVELRQTIRDGGQVTVGTQAQRVVTPPTRVTVLVEGVLKVPRGGTDRR